MESPFERMLRGEEPCQFLAQDEYHAAVLEARPCAPGHTVIFTKKLSDDLFDLPAEALSRLMVYAQGISQALKIAVPCDKVALIAYGLQVRHVHLHLIPARGTPGEITLDKPRPPADPGELERLAASIRAHLSSNKV